MSDLFESLMTSQHKLSEGKIAEDYDLKKSILDLVKEGISHYEDDLGQDWDDDDIVGYVEKRILDEDPDKYPEVVDLITDPIDYVDFYNAVVANIVDLNESTSHKKVNEELVIPASEDILGYYVTYRDKDSGSRTPESRRFGTIEDTKEFVDKLANEGKEYKVIKKVAITF